MRVRRDGGFWSSLGRLRLSQLAQPEFLGALVVGVGGSVAALWFTTLAQRLSTVGSYLVLSASLVGVVFAAMSLIVGLLNRDYIAWLRQSEGGIRGLLTPFMVGIGLQIGTLLVAVGYRLAAPHLPPDLEKTWFVVGSFMFVFAVLDIIAMARNVFAHALLRDSVAEIEELEEARRRRTANSKSEE